MNKRTPTSTLYRLTSSFTCFRTVNTLQNLTTVQNKTNKKAFLLRAYYPDITLEYCIDKFHIIQCFLTVAYLLSPAKFSKIGCFIIIFSADKMMTKSPVQVISIEVQVALLRGNWLSSRVSANVIDIQTAVTKPIWIDPLDNAEHQQKVTRRYLLHR